MFCVCLTQSYLICMCKCLSLYVRNKLQSFSSLVLANSGKPKNSFIYYSELKKIMSTGDDGQMA